MATEKSNEFFPNSKKKESMFLAIRTKSCAYLSAKLNSILHRHLTVRWKPMNRCVFMTQADRGEIMHNHVIVSRG